MDSSGHPHIDVFLDDDSALDLPGPECRPGPGPSFDFSQKQD